MENESGRGCLSVLMEIREKKEKTHKSQRQMNSRGRDLDSLDRIAAALDHGEDVAGDDLGLGGAGAGGLVRAAVGHVADGV